MAPIHAMRAPWSKRFILLLLLTLAVSTLLIFDADQPVNAQINSAFFSVGAGFSDVTPHQIVRTNADRVYIFAAKSQGSGILVGYWTTAAGLPVSSANFNGTATVTDPAAILSVDTAYNGSTIIHVLVNTNNGNVKDYPFDTATSAFKTPITIATDGGKVSGDYIGTAGISGMIDQGGRLNVAYWTSGKHIIHKIYTYTAANNTLAQIGANTQVDSAGKASHPSIAVSPANNSVTVAWVSEANGATGAILARTRTSAGAWGAIETASTSDAWTSPNAGINIDQGPSMVIDGNGTKYLTYIQDYDNTNSYGKVHLATFGASWVDSPVSIAGTDPKLVINGTTYTHDPALAINSAGQLFIVGHGPSQTNVNKNLYTMRRNANGTWAVPKLWATPTSGNTFDASTSIKWGVVGNYRPNTYEFVVFQAINGNYNNTILYYGRFDDVASGPLPTATPTQSVPIRNYYATHTPRLTWNRVSYAVAYQIEVDSTITFALPVAFTATVSANTLSVVTSTLANGVYFWHVRAQNANGTWGLWSAAERFEIKTG